MSGSTSKPGWTGIPLGGVSWRLSEDLKTGDWRGDLKPVVDNAKCKECLFCWIFCPDAAVHWNGTKIAINYDYCKGCGICETECPFDAIAMAKE